MKWVTGANSDWHGRNFGLMIDAIAFFRYTYILLWRYGQVVKTSASQAEIEGSIPSSAILAALSGLLVGRFFVFKQEISQSLLWCADCHTSRIRPITNNKSPIYL